MLDRKYRDKVVLSNMTLTTTLLHVMTKKCPIKLTHTGRYPIPQKNLFASLEDIFWW